MPRSADSSSKKQSQADNPHDPLSYKQYKFMNIRSDILNISKSLHSKSKRRGLATAHVYSKILKQVEETKVLDWKGFCALKWVGDKIKVVFETELDKIYGETEEKSEKTKTSKLKTEEDQKITQKNEELTDEKSDKKKTKNQKKKKSEDLKDEKVDKKDISKPKKSKKMKNSSKNENSYIPRYNSTSYHILQTLFSSDNITRSQISLSVSLNHTEINSLHLNSALKTLIRRNILEKNGKKYILTQIGHDLCNLLFKNNPVQSDEEIFSNNQIDNLSQNMNLSQSNSQNFKKSDVLLLVDNREMKSKTDKTFFERNLNCKNVNLSIGDYIWLKNKNLVNLIIERKKNNDFISSLSDGRFKEQKNRLKLSGVDNLVYLVEGLKNIKETFVENGLITTKLEGFIVIETGDINETVEFLGYLDKIIREKSENFKTGERVKGLSTNSFDYERDGVIEEDKVTEGEENKNLKSLVMPRMKKGNEKSDESSIFYTPTSISFSDFTDKNIKRKDPTELSLLYCALNMIRGISSEKAQKMAEHFKTFDKLFQAIDTGRIFEELKEEKINRNVINSIIEYWGES